VTEGARRLPDGFELRSARLEVRAAGGGRRLEGMAALYGVETRIANRFTEVIFPDAFADTLRSGEDVILLADHDPAKVLARTRAGTLRLRSTAAGLEFETGELPDTTAANDMLALVRSGNAGGMSFGFLPKAGGERWIGDRRELRSVMLQEVSVVSAIPAYQGTRVSARSLRAAEMAACPLNNPDVRKRRLAVL
jgi:hypothetical protein